MSPARPIARTAMTALSVLLFCAGCESNAYLRKIGQDALAEGRIDSAEPALRRAIDQDPTDWKAQFLLGQVLLKKSEPFEARQILENALASRLDVHEKTSEIIDALAEAVYQEGDHDRLVNVLENACRDYGTPYDFLRQGRYLTRAGDVDGAVLAYRKAARFAGRGDVRAYLKMADLFASLGDRPRAVEELRTALAAAPNHRLVYEKLREFGVVPGPTLVDAAPRDR